MQQRAARIPARRLPFGLGAEPGTTLGRSPVAATSSTTMVPGRLALSRVQLFFSYGDDMVMVGREVPDGVDLDGVVALLADGPRVGEAPPGVRSAVEPGDVAGVSVRRGLATVSLVAKFRDLPASEQRRAVHQLTLTLTALPGIGQVTYSVDDTAFGVPKLDGTSAIIVSRDDYAPLVLTKLVTTTMVPASSSTAPLP